MKRAMTREKVRRYVLGRMNGREEIRVEDLAPADAEEFLSLVFVYLYGYDGKSGYRLIRSEEDLLIQTGAYRFHDRKIIRTDEGGH